MCHENVTTMIVRDTTLIHISQHNTFARANESREIKPMIQVPGGEHDSLLATGVRVDRVTGGVIGRLVVSAPWRELAAILVVGPLTLEVACSQSLRRLYV